MKKSLALVTAALAIATAPQAFAQDASSAKQADTNADAGAAGAFSDADVSAYASVAGQLNTIQANTALSDADKQTQMAAAVQQSGLDVAKFNAITEAAKTDTALQKKIQEATQP